MGYVGDTWGPKRALEISIGLMLLPSFLIGCLPSYQVDRHEYSHLSFSRLPNYLPISLTAYLSTYLSIYLSTPTSLLTN